MPLNLRHRDFANLLDFTPAEIKLLLQLARDLKAAKYGGYERPQLTGKNIALIFEKTSTRTRCAFEIAAHDQGAHVTYLGPHESQIGHKESMRDTARVLTRFYDAIEYRGAGQAIVDELVEFADVPIYNGLTNEFHPTQFLADALTMLEHADKPLSQIAYCYIGDCRFNTADTLHDRRLPAGDGRAPVRAIGAVAGPGAGRAGPGDRRRHRRAPHPDRGPGRGRQAASTTSTPTCGCRWASRTRSGPSASSS